MAKLKNNMNTELEIFAEESAEVVKAQPKFTRQMVGSYINPTTGEWHLCNIAFDPATLQLSEMKTERATGDIWVMRERLQIKNIQCGLLDAGEFSEEKKPEKV